MHLYKSGLGENQNLYLLFYFFCFYFDYQHCLEIGQSASLLDSSGWKSLEILICISPTVSTDFTKFIYLFNGVLSTVPMEIPVCIGGMDHH